MTWGVRRVKQVNCHIFISFIKQLKYLFFLSQYHVWRLLAIHAIRIGTHIYTYKREYEYFSGKQMFGWKSWFNFPQELHISEFQFY